MPGGVVVPEPRAPLYEGVARPPERPRSRWDCLGRLNDAVDGLAAPCVYGAAAWLSACRLTWLMRWLKADDSEWVEADPVG